MMSVVTQKCDTDTTGNTRIRSVAITIFDENEMIKFSELPCKYKIFGKEICPNTGRIHWQAYIYFKNARSFKSIKKDLPTAHIEKAIGTAEQNRIYCSKDGDFIEEGIMPQQGKKVSADELRKMTNEEIIDLDSRCHKAYINARDLLNNDLDIDDIAKEIKVYWIQGQSGIGKTEMAKQIMRANSEKLGKKCNLIKYENTFYSGIGEAKMALYDDFRDNHMKASEFINLIDYNKHSMNIKGGNKVNTYNLIIFTSIQKLDEIYKNVHEESQKQWLRRIEVINMYSDENTSQPELSGLSCLRRGERPEEP